MGRLIDADELHHIIFEIGCHRAKMNPMEVMKIIEEQPTAYDVEKVVAELDALKKKADYMQRSINGAIAHGEYKAFKKAMQIVRKGGVNE